MSRAEIPPDHRAAVGLYAAARMVPVAPAGSHLPVARRLGVTVGADPALARLGREQRPSPRILDRPGWFLPLRLSLFPSLASASSGSGRRSVSLFRILYRRSYSRGCGYC